LLFIIIATNLLNLGVALFKTFGEGDFRAYNKNGAWINAEGAATLLFFIYFLVVKFQFDLNHANKQELLD
jgi:hypothetical protein